KDEDPGTSLWRAQKRSVINLVLDSVLEPFRRPLKSCQHARECFSGSVSNQVRNILDDEQARSKNCDIIRYRRENAVVTVSAVMMPISELAKPFARRPGCEEFDVAETSTIGFYSSPPPLAEQIGNGCDLAPKVMVVNRDRLVP